MFIIKIKFMKRKKMGELNAEILTKYRRYARDKKAQLFAEGYVDDDHDGSDSATWESGGGVYVVALQQARFQVDPSTEDRWTYQMQLVCESRKDVVF